MYMKKGKFSFLESGKMKLKGLPDFYVRFVENFHLKEREIWASFVRAFILKLDTLDKGWRGEYWGKMMRGACLCYHYTKNQELYEVLRETVEALLKTQDELGRFSTYDLKNEFQGWDMWGRKYVATGMFHFLNICADTSLKNRILNALCRHFDYIIKKIGNAEGQKEITQTSHIWGAVNSCTILEPVLELYQRTGDAKYLRFGEYIISTGGSNNGDLVKVAVENRLRPCEYPVVKAYEVMSFFEGVLSYYKITEKEYYFKAVCNFVKAIKDSEITLIGCAGYLEECLNNAVVKQTEYAELPTQETCVTVTWMRLLAKLYALTGNVEYINDFEISALNALYGSVNVYKEECYSNVIKKTGGVFAFDSYSPLFEGTRNREVGGFKQLDDGSYYGCCACIGSAAIALVPLISVMKGEDGYVINEYFNGKMELDDGFSIKISGNYPADDNIVISVEDSDEKERTLILRVPAWCEKFTISLFDKSVEAQKGTYILKKRWVKGDQIAINMKHSLRTEERNGYTAFLYGPLVLARDSLKGECSTPLSVVNFDLDLSLIETERKVTKQFETVRFEIGRGNQKIILSDYASCGKHWSHNNGITIWLKVKSDEWKRS